LGLDNVIYTGRERQTCASASIQHTFLGHFDLPILGVNELFDLDGRLLAKNYGGGVLQGTLDFPLTLSDPTERMPLSIKYLNFMADRHMHYGHVVPNVNLFLIRRKDIMKRLINNKANPTIFG
uniref:Amidohydro-rel domain-containing protein n=1 Tax=Gongylonema pulchrum TaxID=637853 RepID=A0A183D2S0_9BILA